MDKQEEKVEQTNEAEQTFEQAWGGMNKADQAETQETTEDTQAEQAAETTQTAQASQPADPFANLPEEQLRAVRELQNRIVTAESTAAAASARASHNQRELNRYLQEQEARQRQQATPASPTAAQVTQALKTPEGWKKLQEDYPSIAAPIEEFLTHAVSGVESKITQRLQETVEKQVSPLLQRATQEDRIRQENFLQEQYRLLGEAHPDFTTIKDAPEFKEWLGKQAPMVQAGIRSQHAADAIAVLNLYKGSKTVDTVADLQKARNQRLQQAATVQGVSGKASQQVRQTIPDTFEAAWDSLARQSATSKK